MAIFMRLPEGDGVYEYDSGIWYKNVLQGPYVPSVDGIYLLYFRNRKCGGCKSFDRVFLGFIRDIDLRKYGVRLIQCNNFFYDCGSQDAADTFIFYLVFSTPQIIVVVVENGLPIYIEREIGVIDEDRLRDFVMNLDNRRKEYSILATNEEDDEEGIYIDFSSRDWKSIVNRIKEELFRGRNIREVCNEDGCRISIE